MNFLFAWRYFKAKKSTNAINIIAWTSITAIIIGTAALILVLSVFNGFEGLVKSLYSSFYTDLKISPASGKVMTISPEQIQKLKSADGIKNFSMVLEEKALIQNGDNQTVIYLKGVDTNYINVTEVAKHLLNDAVFDIDHGEASKIILGAGVVDALGIYADRNIFSLKVYLPRKSDSKQIDLMEDISSDTIQFSAAFLIQQDFDNKYGITNIDFVRRALRLNENEYSGIEIAVKDPDEVGRVGEQLKKIFGGQYLIQNRYEQNRSLYSVMNIERWIVYGVLCLILVVAAFNMIGALTMLVLEKQKDIGVLHALGGNRNFIQRIFLSEGLLLALIGGGIGMLLAFLIATLQIKYHPIPLQGGSFLIDYYPVKLYLRDFLLVGTTVFVIAFIASWFPSRKASRQEFSLRSE
ncbi:MAG TPA: FtsX-like permease family protein [Chitinophagaceae bacterium]|nr:FtsX-like permease family protein [Chitinophagaceae bacterium]HNU12914.1 FtsX-like permease family protein [Chitinophagaceae bacterium]